MDTAAVRPFWGRTVLWYGGSIAAVWLVTATLACGYFRSIGYNSITPLDTAWPPRWSRVERARSGLFLQQAKRALAQMDERAMRVSLASAAAAAADDYPAQLAIAQIYSHLADQRVASQTFQRLLADFPAERHQTAVAYHDALLAARQFSELGEFAVEYLARQPKDDATVWLRAAFGGLRGSPWPRELLQRKSEALGKLPPLWRDALTAEANARALRSVKGFNIAGIPVTSANAALLILMGETVADLAAPGEAVDAIVRVGPAVGAFERNRLLFRLQMRLGATNAALQAFDAMLREAGRAAQRERLLATLVEFPDRQRCDRLVGAASNPQTPFSQIELGGLWIASAACGHEQLRTLAARRLRTQFGYEVDPSMPTALGPANAAIWIRVLPVGRETVWALATKFAPRRAEKSAVAE